MYPRWYRRSLLLESDNNFLIESRGTLHTFIIRTVDTQHFGNYRCLASNSLGREAAEIQLTGQTSDLYQAALTVVLSGLPKAPVFQSAILSAMSDSHRLTWLTESYSNILEYKLKYRKIMVGIRVR